jgi:hypothetical protein
MNGSVFGPEELGSDPIDNAIYDNLEQLKSKGLPLQSTQLQEIAHRTKSSLDRVLRIYDRWLPSRL